MVVQPAPSAFNASVSLVATTSAVVHVLISKYEPEVDVVNVGQCSLFPVDGQQALVQHAIAVRAIGCPDAELQCVHGQQDRPVLVEHIEIGRQPGPVGTGHPREAVTGGARGGIGTDPAYAKRQQKTCATCNLGFGMSRNRLETGIQQERDERRRRPVASG